MAALAHIFPALPASADWSLVLTDDDFREMFDISAAEYRGIRAAGWIIATDPNGARDSRPAPNTKADADEIECFGATYDARRRLARRGFRYRPLPGWSAHSQART